VIVSLEEYQAVLELNQALQALCVRAADALENYRKASDNNDLIAQLRKAAQ